MKDIKYQLFIDGQWTDPSGGEWFDTEEPYTGRRWAQIPRCTEHDVDRAVGAAHRAFTEGEWPAMSATQRGHVLRRLGDLLREHGEALARVEARDNGKRISEAVPQFRYLPE